MGKLRKSFPVVFMLFIVWLFILPVTAQDDDNILRIGHYFVGNGWDPANQNIVPALWSFDPLYDTLITLDAEGNYQPRLATDWTYDDDTTLTLTLRDDVVFSDGTPFTAEVAVANLLRAKSQGGAFVQTALASLSDATALDETTLRLTLSARDDFFLQSLVGYAGMMMSPAAFDSADTMPIGSGPWLLNTEETIPGSLFVYDRFSDHWNNNPDTPDRIEVRLSNPPDILNALIADDIDIVTLPAGLTVLLQGLDVTIQAVDSTYYTMAILDRGGELVPELADNEVRCALVQAMNRDAYVQVNGPQVLSAIAQIPPVGWYAYNPDIETISYNPDAARDTLANAGLTTLQAPTSPGYQSRHEAMMGFLADVGVTVETQLVDSSEIISTVYSGDYPIAFIQLEPENFITFVQNYVLADGAFNPFGYVDEEIEALATEALALPLDEAEPLWQEISALLNQRCYFAPLAIGSLAVISGPDVENLGQRFRANGFADLRNVTLNRD